MFFPRLYSASSRSFATSLGETLVCKSRKRLTASFTLFGVCGSLKVVKALLKFVFFSLLVFALVFWPSVSRICWVARRHSHDIQSRLIEVSTRLAGVYNSCVAASVRFSTCPCARWHASRCLGQHPRR